MVTTPIKCVQAKPRRSRDASRARWSAALQCTSCASAHRNCGITVEPSSAALRARTVEDRPNGRAGMDGFDPKPCSRIAAVAWRRVRDRLELSIAGIRFQARFGVASPKKMPIINVIESTSTMRKDINVDLAQSLLRCGRGLREAPPGQERRAGADRPRSPAGEADRRAVRRMVSAMRKAHPATAAAATAGRLRRSTRPRPRTPTPRART